MSRFTLFLPLALFFGLFAVFYWVLTDEDYDPQALPSALLDKPVPQFSLLSLAEQKAVTQDIFKEEVTVLNIWASWCLTCRVEHPFFQTLSEQGVNLIGLNYKDDRNDAINWLKELGNPYRLIIADPDGKLGLDLGVYGAPETYLIDQQGLVKLKHVGELTPAVWEADFMPIINQLNSN